MVVCRICSEPFIDPMKAQCKHTFCKACILAWSKGAPSVSCPVCRAEVNMDDGFVDVDDTMNDLLGELEVHCLKKSHEGKS